jgi:hypothetical protein
VLVVDVVVGDASLPVFGMDNGLFNVCPVVELFYVAGMIVAIIRRSEIPMAGALTVPWLVEWAPTQPVPLMTLPAGHDVHAPLIMPHARHSLPNAQLTQPCRMACSTVYQQHKQFCG